MVDQFRVRTCFVGVGDFGAERVEDGTESRDGSGQMVPSDDPAPSDVVVETGASVLADRFASFDVVVVTGSVTEEGAVDTAARIGDCCDPDAITVAIFTGESRGPDRKRLEASFGTVVSTAKRDVIREVVTDVFTAFTQPTMLETDYGRVRSNLRDGGSVSRHRAVGDRDDLTGLVAQCRGPGAVVLGYVEAGSAFTLRDAERLEGRFERPEVVTGQATLDAESGCRLTLLRGD